MKLNQVLLVAAMAAGSLAVAGCSKSADVGATNEDATTEQASVAVADGTVQAASKDEGFEQDARWARGGFGRGEHRGFGRGEHRGWGRGERGEHRGWGRGEGFRRRPWWRFW
jgi:hypothetical protein